MSPKTTKGTRPLNAKGQCRVCHHRTDLHYADASGRVTTCHAPQAGGMCGCVGRGAGATGDVPAGKSSKPIRYPAPRKGAAS